jgi:hypothetical protein
MRAALRFSVCLLLSCSIAVAAVPAPMPVRPIEKTDCCAKMNAKSAVHDCDRHAPKSDQEKQCCASCAFCVALYAAFAAPFVYPPVGEETFAAFTLSEQRRSQRPPVPPPRA